MYLDSKNLIVTKSGDGGDSAAETGRYYMWLWILKNKLEYGIENFPVSKPLDFAVALNALQKEPGVFIRNPEKYNQPEDFSRDQTTPIIAAMGLYGFQDTVKKVVWKRLKRFGRYPNSDVASPEHWAIDIRALRCWPLYPFIALMEISVLLGIFLSPWYLLLMIISPGLWQILGVLIQNYKMGKDHDKYVGETLNGAVTLLQAKLVYPTPSSLFSAWLFAKFCPAWKLVIEVGEQFSGVPHPFHYEKTYEVSGVQYSFNRYYRAEAESNTEIAEMVKPINRKYF